MASDLVYGTPLNGDTVALNTGEVVRVSANNRVQKALADATAHVQGLQGIVASGVVGVGGPVNIVTAAAHQAVRLEAGLTPQAGQTLYVSATQAGRATNVAPTLAVAIGTIEDVGSYARDQRVFATIIISASAVDAPGHSSAPIIGDGTIGDPFTMLDAAPGVTGAMSANDATKVFETEEEQWCANVQAIMFGEIPGLNRFIAFKPGVSGIPLVGAAAGANPAALPTGITDATIDGGGILSTFEGRWTWGTIFQHMKTSSKSAWCFRGSLPAIAAGKYGHFGLSNVARTQFPSIAWTNNNVSPTKFALSIVGALFLTNQPAISDADTNPHDFIGTLDPTVTTPTMKLWIDDIVEATITDLSNLADQPVYLEHGTDGGGVTAVGIERIAFAWVE